MHQISTALVERQYQDQLEARWAGGPTVLAFLFAPPDTNAIRQLDERGEYFNIRSGDTWDLFIPGYYQSDLDVSVERQTGARRVGRRFTASWYFSARDFDSLRAHIETSSGGRFQYSGEADLVLINAWVPEHGPPTIDWVSTIAGQLTDASAATATLTFSSAVERISRDLEAELGDESYGVGELWTSRTAGAESHVGRDLIVTALGEIAAALATKTTGLT